MILKEDLPQIHIFTEIENLYIHEKKKFKN